MSPVYLFLPGSLIRSIRGKWGQAPPSGGKKELQAHLIKSWLIHWSISLCVKTFWMSMNYFLNLYIINHSLLCDGLGRIQPPASLTLPAAHSIGVQLGGWGRPLLSLLRAGTWEKSKCACSGYHSSQRHSLFFFCKRGQLDAAPLQIHWLIPT